ncbi:hypothetical protein ACFLW6_04865, partial [Chloroflexota bacterium]
MHGNCIHLNERECSVQRRHQKLIEESPSPVLTPKIRAEMGAASVRAMQAANYVNAGTVEFLYEDGKFYFNEVNARLQVEHPITEMVSGVDLVKEQIRIAAGEPLQYRQEDIKQEGHAIECRICVEDALQDFMPTPDKIKSYHAPGSIGIRLDSGVYAGYTVPPYYDSLVAKLCSWGKNREEAMERMQRALYEYIIIGPITNIPFHLAVLENETFRKGDYATTFINENPEIFPRIEQIIEENPGLKLKSYDEENKKKAAIAAAAIETTILESDRVEAHPPYSGWSWQAKQEFAERGWY